MNFFSKSFMKHVCFALAVVFLFTSCAALQGQIKYPDTPIGQGALLLGGYHDQVDIYLQDVSWASDPGHIDILKKRLNAIQLANGNFKEIARYVNLGQTIPEALLRSTKASLTELKKWLYSRQSVVPSAEAVEAALIKAHVIPEQRSQAWESVVLLLIELVQAFGPMMDRLVQMGEMTPEQIQAEWDYHYQWLQTFDPYALPVPGA